MNATGSSMEAADFIVVGGGSAGAVVAARLSEDPATTVLLLEAGAKGGGFVVDMPAGVFKLIGSPKADWRFAMEADPTIGGRSITMPAGRMLGGGSAINGLVYIRGTRGDFDAWQTMGATGWGWDEVFPYFLRAESFEGPPSQQHGAHGPLSVSPGRTVHPLADSFVDACEQTGFHRLHDYCGGDQLGAFRVHSTTKNGQRSSTASAYLAAARQRPNLRIVTEAQVEKILIEGGRAIGLRLRRGEGSVDVTARREVILSAGAIGSPAILQRSGIGPGADLQAAGVSVVVERSGVGANLQDHPVASISKLVNVPTYNSAAEPLQLLKNTLNYLLFKRGPLTSAAVQAMAFGRTSDRLTEPDIMLSFLPLCIDLSGTTPKLHSQPGVSVACNVCRPQSRGRLRIVSADAGQPPRIELPFLASPRDLELLIAGLKIVERVFAAPALRRHVVANNQPDQVPQSDDEWADYVRGTLGASYHPVGTCRMGSDADAVVDPALRVRGVSGLRVIDASVMPQLVSGNTNAAAVMIGEKGAELVRTAS